MPTGISSNRRYAAATRALHTCSWHRPSVCHGRTRWSRGEVTERVSQVETAFIDTNGV